MNSIRNLVDNPVETVKANIAHRRGVSNVFTQVVAVLKRFEGKKITAAIGTAVTKALPTYYVSMTKFGSSDCAILKVWGEGVPYNDLIWVVLGYDSDPIFKMVFFEERNQRYFLENTRLSKLEARLAELPDLCEEYRLASDRMLKAEAAFGNLLCLVMT